MTGTSKSHQRAKPDAIMDLSVVLAPKTIADAYESVASPLLNRTLICRREIGTLGAIRDALLPKLVSGGLRMGQAGRVVEDAVA